jgi:hypothetical protein
MASSSAPPRRLIVAITGATGAVYGLRLLDMLPRSQRRRDPPAGVERRLAQRPA